MKPYQSSLERLKATYEGSTNSKKKRKEKILTGDPSLFPHYDDLVRCPHCPGAYANEITKFVGFRGHLDTFKHPKGGTVELAILDMKGEEYPGEVHPEPIVPVTNINRDNLMRLTGRTREELGRRFYLGILGYEVAVLTLLFTLYGMGHENVMVLMPRGVGKTYMEDWENAFDMKHQYKNILLLSESDAMLKVGNWIYTWAFNNDYLKDSSKNSRQSSYQHFTLKNGAQMDLYRFMDKKTVGIHDVKIVGDDIINLDWKNRPSDNRRAIEHWHSNLNMMIRIGLEIFGTRKFEGDPLQHLMETIEDLVIIKLSPFIQCTHENKNSQGTFDPCHVCRDLCLLAPELHSYEEYMDKMEENYESWYSEQMQDPHAKAGGMVEEDDILYIQRPFFPEARMICISVDVAEEWEDSTTSDMSAVVSCVMTSEQDERKKHHRKFTFYKANVSRMPFRNTKDKKGKMHRGLIETIDEHVKYAQLNYPNIPLIIAIERNGPGIILINQILREQWPWMKRIIADKGQAVKWTKEGRANIPLGIKHQKEKTPRIFSELRHSIKEHQTRFTFNLEDTVFMTQVLTFPKGKHDDGPDAGGMGKDELNRRWVEKKDPILKETEREKKERERTQNSFNKLARPWETVQRNASERNRRNQQFKRNMGY